MPTYQYQCSACAHSFEQYQSIKADPLIHCPNCKQDNLQKLISGGSGHFLHDSGVLPEAKPKSPSSLKKDHGHSHGDSHDLGHVHGHGHCDHGHEHKNCDHH